MYSHLFCRLGTHMACDNDIERRSFMYSHLFCRLCTHMACDNDIGGGTVLFKVIQEQCMLCGGSKHEGLMRPQQLLGLCWLLLHVCS